MISRENLRKISKGTSLHLYQQESKVPPARKIQWDFLRQQEKDYLIKLFLFYYFRKYEHAVFKGGTCIKYLYNTDRFSEDIDFNLLVHPEDFKKEVRSTLQEFKTIGIQNGFIKEEIFQDAYTAEIWFYGPLYDGINQTQNKFRIDAGERGGTLKEPKWRLIGSEYPETHEKFLAQILNESELLAEKIITMFTRSKGRDMYDVWYLLNNDISLEPDFFEKKVNVLLEEKIIDEFSWGSYPSEEEYLGDMERLSPRVLPYDQVLVEVKNKIDKLKDDVSL